MSESSGLRDFLQTPTGKGLSVGLIFIALGLLGYSIWSNFTASGAVAAATDPLFIDAQTGQTFNQKLTIGMHIPVTSPFSGKQDGYPAELCYWNKDGSVRKDPFPVLLNEEIGKPGPTFCPDCGRLVVHHNPAPGPGVVPPPTKEEYESGNYRRSLR